MRKSKYEKYNNTIIKLAKENDYQPYTVAKLLGKQLGVNGSGNAIASHCKKIINGLSQDQEVTVSSKTKPNDYKQKFVLSAWNHI